MKSEDNTQSPLKSGSFISFDKTSEHAFGIFLDQLDNKAKGFYITRDSPKIIEEKNKSNFETYWMNQKSMRKNSNMLVELNKKIRYHIKKNKKATVLLERIDYIVNLYGFENFLKFIYSVNEDIISSNTTLIVHANPVAVNEKERALLNLELTPLPRPEYVEQIRLSKDLYDILELVKTKETKVNFKNICKTLFITKATVRKRIYELQRRHLVTIRKDGRSKIVELAPEGNNIML